MSCPTSSASEPGRRRGRGLEGRKQRTSEETGMETLMTDYGRVQLDTSELMLGELVVTDEGAELEVVSLDPLRFELAPTEEEDWGE